MCMIPSFVFASSWLFVFFSYFTQVHFKKKGSFEQKRCVFFLLSMCQINTYSFFLFSFSSTLPEKKSFCWCICMISCFVFASSFGFGCFGSSFSFVLFVTCLSFSYLCVYFFCFHVFIGFFILFLKKNFNALFDTWFMMFLLTLQRCLEKKILYLNCIQGKGHGRQRCV